jgi:phosphoribosylformylglycinamidine synthase
MKPKVCVLGGYGINSEEETIFAFNETGSEAEFVHVNELISCEKSLEDYQILVFPGGFSYGDHTGSGKAMANKLMNNIGEELMKFIERDALVLGICNGFQILVALGLLPALNEKYGTQQAGLLQNNSARFVCRYVNLKKVSEKCIWTKNINKLFLPVAHGEGNFYLEPEALEDLAKNDQIALQYINSKGNPAKKEFPYNPNGADMDIAGICDPSGRIFGMMPHPERGLFFSNRPDFTLERERLLRIGKEIPKWTENIKIFENAAKYFTDK